MTEEEIEHYKNTYELMEMNDIEIVGEAKATLMKSRKIRAPGYTRIEDVSLLAIGILLNLIEKQQSEKEQLKAELEKKERLYQRALSDLVKADNKVIKQDKMIDLMLELIVTAKFAYFKKEDGGELLGKYRLWNKEEWKQYFEKQVEKE